VRPVLKWTLLGFAALLLVLQLVPYGRDHANPRGRPVAWDSPRTEELMRGACMDCHSYETEWPWYSNVAPISWLVQNDVDEGRDRLNVSLPGRVDAEEMIEAIQEGEMPPWQYKPLHAGARLSDSEKQELIRGIRATFG
jgi:mono/diheme cytochrome c family protein